jgi:hypothetical protein
MAGPFGWVVLLGAIAAGDGRQAAAAAGNLSCFLRADVVLSRCDHRHPALTTYTHNASGWAQHTSTNCFSGRGATSLTGNLAPGFNFTVERCETACLAHAGCTAICLGPAKPKPPAPPPGPPAPPPTPDAPMQRVLIPPESVQEHGAACLSGAPPNYEVRRNTSSARWIIFLEGGGWCFGNTTNATVKLCAAHAGLKPHMKGWAEEGGRTSRGALYGGFLSGDRGINPDFYTWNAVYVPNCNFASFASSRPDPVVIPGGASNGSDAKIFLRGRNTFDAVIADLLGRQNMSQATDVILSGGSSGGLGVLYNIDHLATLLPKPGPRLTGFADAGFFMGEASYVADMRGGDAVWNITGSGSTNRNCLAAYPATEQWKCLLAPYLLEHIEADLYLMNSAYDAWQLENECLDSDGRPCVNGRGSPPVNTPATQAYGVALKAAVWTALAAKTSGRNGCFIDSCFVHQQNIGACWAQKDGAFPNCVGWSPGGPGALRYHYWTAIKSNVTGDLLTPRQAFSRYYFSNGSSPDSMLIDQELLQTNPSCIYGT